MSTWTEERVAECKRLHEAGYSASKIAAELREGVTRNAVIGIIHRKGWARNSKPIVRGQSGPPKERKPRGPYVRREGKLVRHNAGPSTPQQRANGQRTYLEAAEATDLPADVSPFACTLVELNAGQCRWPLGDPASPDFRFCGAKAFTDRPYCARHCALAYTAPKRLNISEEERQRRVRQARMNNEKRKSFKSITGGPHGQSEEGGEAAEVQG